MKPFVETIEPLQRLVRDRKGAVIVLVAVGLTSMLGFLSMGTEMGIWYSTRRALQNAADAGALGGATELSAGSTGATVIKASTVDVNRNNIVAGNGSTVTVNNPPLTGKYTGNAQAVEVVLNQPQTLLLSSLFMKSSSISARSVALYSNSGTGKYCVLGLDTSSADTVLLNNNAVLPNQNCGVASNSSSPRGLDLTNNAIISGPVSAMGGYVESNNAVISGATKTGIATADPYSGIPAPGLGPCSNQTASGKNGVTVNLTPGRFCNGLNFNNNAIVNMAPGTYYVESQFSFQNNAVLNATSGVTLVIVGNQSLNIGNNAQINVTAPTTGTYAGMAFMGDRTGTSTVTQVFSNNAVFNINGVIYFPNQTVEMDNNATTNPNGCSQVIGRKVVFSNNVNLPSNCSGTGVKPMGAATIALVE